MKEEPMGSELVWAVLSDGGEWMGKKKDRMEVLHPHPLSSMDRKKPEAYARDSLRVWGYSVFRTRWAGKD